MVQHRISRREISKYLTQCGYGGAGVTDSLAEMKFDHADCPAGVDTRKRLYIRSTDKGWLAYCHNCGGGGFKAHVVDPLTGVQAVGPHAGSGSGQSKKSRAGLTALADFFDLYETEVWHRFDQWRIDLLMSKFPEFKPEWVRKYRAVATCGAFAGAASLILPAGFKGDDWTPKLLSVKSKIRSVGAVPVPKWLHYNRDGDRTPPIIDNPEALTKACVIVEDRISAIAVVEAMGGRVAACTLSGTHITDEDLFKLTMLFDRFIVWLDNDSNLVVQRAQELQRKLRMYKSERGAVARVMYNDPKKYAGIDIAGKLNYLINTKG